MTQSGADNSSSPTSGPTSGSRREEILAVAAKVIAEKGLAGATVRDIGQAAGILSGSLYYHFDSKEQIVVDLLYPSLAASLEESQVHVGESADHTKALTGLIRIAIKGAAGNPYNSLILRNESHLYESSDSLRAVAELRSDSRDLWTSVLSEGIAAGEFRSDIHVDIAIRAIFDSILGAARWFIEDPDTNEEQVCDTLIALVVDGIRA